MFEGVPTSLLAAIGPFAERHGTASLGLMDPGAPSPEFDAELDGFVRDGQVRCVCISTSTAAIEEAAKVAVRVKEQNADVLVILGGPHEDDMDVRAAHKLSGVDVSIAGEAEFGLRSLLEAFLDEDGSAAFRGVGEGLIHRGDTR